jgi:hypothetical protein
MATNPAEDVLFEVKGTRISIAPLLPTRSHIAAVAMQSPAQGAPLLECQILHERQEPKLPSHALPPFDVPMHLDGRRCATVPQSRSTTRPAGGTRG